MNSATSRVEPPVVPGEPVGHAISIRSVSLAYGANQVLSDVSLAVGAGEIVSLIGPSGCGKTTLLNVIAGLVRPDGGDVEVRGTPVTAPGPDRVVVFQDDAVFPWMTVRRNVEYGLKIKGVPPAERKQAVDDGLELVGLTRSADLFPRQLSGGMRKRVDLARALVMRPSVVLMDEPYAALDAMTKERLQVQFADIAGAAGSTSVFVTHDLEEALFIGDRVVVMAPHPGRIAAVHDVPFARPRSVELKLEPEFQQMRGVLARQIFAVGQSSEQSDGGAA